MSINTPASVTHTASPPQSASPASPPPSPTTARFGGLDGLRAIAVGLVLVYHLFPSALPGGFLGVDVFFVISGFLIASLLIRERQRSGRIDLWGFWRRRARRLLPALGLVLLVCTSLALLAMALSGNGGLLVNIGAQILGALFFVSNWVFIALGGDYFTRDNPELYRNTWSLSIEEQFYLLLPLLILFALRAHSRITRSLLFVLLAVGSATLMAIYAAQGELPTRIYFGSDTHVFGLFAGVSLAVLLQPVGARSRPARRLGTGAQLGLIATALLGLIVLGWLSATLAEAGPESFEGGFQLASAAALLTIWAVTRPGAWAGRALDAQPLRWVGERSYGIYLWHWPLLLIVPVLTGAGSASSPLTALLVLALTLVFAALSHRFVEQPIRRLGLRRSMGLFVRFPRQAGAGRALAVALAAVLLVTIPASIVAVTTAPARSSAAEAIARGQERLQAQKLYEAEQAIAEHGFAGVIDSLDGSVGSPTGPPTLPEPVAEPEPEPTPGDQIFALGDSVMLASLPELQAEFPGIWIDAAVSRSLGAGIGITAELAAQGQLRPVLVVGLGTNGPIVRSDLSELKRIADTRPIVLVNAHGDRWWIPEVNETLASFANARRGVVLADWNSAVAGVPDALAGDGIHPNPSGGELYAAAVRQALEELQTPAERLS